MDQRVEHETQPEGHATMDIQLTEEEARVLGCLIEKSVTTPDNYPLTLNSLVLACNQKSNRDPVMALDEREVRTAIETLRYEYHLLWEIAEAGSRVPKYKHDIEQILGEAARQIAVMAVLMLRGPQTPGALRTYTARYCTFEDLGAVTTTLEELAQRENGPFVIQLPREPGSREAKYAQLMCGPIDMENLPEPVAPVDQGPTRLERIAELEGTVAAVQTELAALKAEFETFKGQF